MATEGTTDPTRATFVAILQQLNRAESLHEGRPLEQALELEELRRSLRQFWAIDEGLVQLPVALGLLVRNGLVQAELPGPVTVRGRSTARARYRLTPQGKQFLLEALEKADRIV